MTAVLPHVAEDASGNTLVLLNDQWKVLLLMINQIQKATIVSLIILAVGIQLILILLIPTFASSES